MGTGGTTQLSPLDFVKVCTAYLQNYTEDSMEHFRVMTKLRMLSTFVCLAAVSSGQRQPIALRFQLALLGRFRIRAVSESTAPLRVCLFDSSAYPQNYTEDKNILG